MPYFNKELIIQLAETEDTELIPEETQMVIAAATVISAPIALAALAPPPLPMFPPQGIIQPGNVVGGGGGIPASVLTVRKSQPKFYFRNYLLLK